MVVGAVGIGGVLVGARVVMAGVRGVAVTVRVRVVGGAHWSFSILSAFSVFSDFSGPWPSSGAMPAVVAVARARAPAATRTAVSSSAGSRTLTRARPWAWVEMSPAPRRMARCWETVDWARPR